MKKQINLLLKITGVSNKKIINQFRFSTKKENKNLQKEANIQANVDLSKNKIEKSEHIKSNTDTKVNKNNTIVEDYFDINSNPIKNEDLDNKRKNRIIERLDQFRRDNNYTDKLFYLKYQWSKIQRDKIQYNLTHISPNLNVYQKQECDAIIKIISSFKHEDFLIFYEEIMRQKSLQVKPRVPSYFDPNFSIYQQLILNLLPFIISGHFMGGVSKKVETEVKKEESNNIKKEEVPVKKAEKTHVDIKLVSFDQAKKITLIKEVKTIFNLGLKESKEAVEKTDDFLKKAVKIEEAKEIQQKLEAFGAKIELL